MGARKLAAPSTTWLDRAFLRWAPAAGYRRLRARAAAATIELSLRKYEGAAVGRRTQGWRTSSSSANAEIGPSLIKLRDRCRALVRDNPWAKKAVRHIASQTVGTGIVPRARGRDVEESDRAQELWARWGETTQVDPEGRCDFYGIQALCARAVAESGEVLVRRRRRRASDGLAVPLQLQVLESDHLDHARNEMRPNGNRVVQGVEFDRLGRRVAYWLFPDHPGDSWPLRASNASQRVPARDVLHVFLPERAGQVRGVPWGAACVLRLRDLDEYEDAQLMRQKIASCFAAFVHDLDGGMSEGLGEPGKTDVPIDQLEPGTIEYLPPGKGIEFARPPAVEGYEDFSRVTLRSVAAAFGVSYESLTGDLTRVNFSSGRMGWLTEQRDLGSWRKLYFVPGLCQGVWRWFGEAASLAGELERGMAATWTPPRREMIQPGAEVRAMREQIESGMLSLSEAIRQLGYDPRGLLRELGDDVESLAALGLTTSLGVGKSPPPV